MEGLLPDSILNRKKQGFAFPLGIWMQNSKLTDLVGDCFSKNGLAGREYLSSPEVERVYRRAMREDPNKPRSFSHYRLWQLTVLELWLRAHSASPGPAAAAAPAEARAIGTELNSVPGSVYFA